MSSGATVVMGDDRGSAGPGEHRLALRLDLQGLRAGGQGSLVADYLGTAVALEAARREWTGNLISTAAYECLETAVRLGAETGDVVISAGADGNEVAVDCRFPLAGGHKGGAADLAERVNAREAERVMALLQADALDVLGLSELGLGMVGLTMAARSAVRCTGEGEMEVAFRMAQNSGEGATG